MDQNSEHMIKSYLEGEMSEPEKLAFEEELERDADLKVEYLVYKSVYSDLKAMSMVSESIHDPGFEDAYKLAEDTIDEHYWEIETKDDPVLPKEYEESEKQISEDHSKSDPGKLRRIFYYISGAAAILGAILIIDSFLLKPDPDRLFSTYYTSFDMPLDHSRGQEDLGHASLIQAYNLYRSEQISQADSLLRTIRNRPADRSLYQYLLGLVEIESGQYQTAFENLTENLDRNDPLYLEKNWYAGLCLLKLGNIGSARQYFEIIKENPNRFQSDARKLLRKTERLVK